MRAKLSPSQANALAAAPTRDTEAYDLFLKGEYQERQAESTYKAEIYDRAATFYRQALARDPNFVLAYARLAYNRLHRHWFVNRLTLAQLGEVKSEIERALAIAPDSPEAHLALGMFHYYGRRDFESALRALDRPLNSSQVTPLAGSTGLRFTLAAGKSNARLLNTSGRLNLIRATYGFQTK